VRFHCAASLEEEIGRKNYIKSYEEYDYQKRTFFFMDTSGLTGSDLEDNYARRLVIFLYD
jgi:hypothetical protein